MKPVHSKYYLPLTDHGPFLLFYPQEVVKDGLRFPAVGLDNPSTVSCILLQQPGKLKAKQIREGKEKAKNSGAVTVCLLCDKGSEIQELLLFFLAAVQAQKDVTGSTKQMKVSAEIFLNAGFVWVIINLILIGCNIYLRSSIE